ncbi:transcription factor PERIANTHIA-like [Malus domestica]|uniref:transcription factor PERIANTHIA-like n=1 Tax=Malus domestica TaxID=3750 RepID=UPI003975A524
MADNSQQTDTYTDVDTDDKNHLHGVQHGALMVADSTEQAKERTTGDQKAGPKQRSNKEESPKEESIHLYFPSACI